jgi:inosose dehydratase
MSTITIGTGIYPLLVALGGGEALDARLDEMLAAHAAAGLRAWEPFALDAGPAAKLGGALKRHGMVLPSYYANARLHDEGWRASVDEVLRQAEGMRALGAHLVVSNPEPIRWGGPENKSDAELKRQADALNVLGRRLAPLGIKVAYHFHDPEFRCGAREVHHMMMRTDPAVVGLCFDTHWAYRGCGDSQEAMFDLLERYADRVVSYHLRQSSGGVWTEAFGAGDIDYTRWAAFVKARGWSGPVHLEQAWETGTPRTGDILAAQAQSAAYLRSLL